MILHFLRLFLPFRALESDRDTSVMELRKTVQELTTEKLILQDRLDNVLADRGNLWDMMKTAIENERGALKTMANYRVQSTYGVTPYPEAGAIESHPMEPMPRNIMPSERVTRANQRFTQRFSDTLAEQNRH